VDDKLILLVEDNPDDKLLALRAFKKNSITTKLIVVRDGAEALDYLFGTGEFVGRDVRAMPHIILLDLKLPKVDGFEVLRRMRAQEITRLLPVVILSSSLEPQDLVKSYLLGANSYIRKPVDFGEFTRVVRELWTYWLSFNQNPPLLGHVN
jgi:two-component system response regulator